MFNLLPQEQKKKIRQIYLRRFSIVVIIGVIVFTLIGCVLLLPSFVISAQKLKSAEDRKNVIAHSISVTDKDLLQAQFAEIKSDIKTLENKDQAATDIVEKILLNKGPGVSFQSLSLKNSSVEERDLVINGIAENRDKLKQFLGRMESQNFKKVNLPISNFAKEKDIAFTMNITISNE